MIKKLQGKKNDYTGITYNTRREAEGRKRTETSRDGTPGGSHNGPDPNRKKKNNNTRTT
jgi:hypothetical protein